MVRFGGISGSFGLDMGILARLRLAKIQTMAWPNSPDMPPKRTKKVRLGINITLASKRVNQNRPYLYSWYWTGTSLQWRLMRVIFSNANDMMLFLMIFPRISLHCKLVPVQYREYEYGLLDNLNVTKSTVSTYLLG